MRVGNVKPGLYYGYVMASELAGLDEAQSVLQSVPAANSDPLTLRIENSRTPSAFYRIVVSEVRPQERSETD